MQLTITGYSTALFATWYFIEELNLLFDCGDGLAATLLQKSRKIEHVFISHPDRDHLTGLLQFNQLNARPGAPKIYYPCDCGSFEHLRAFSSSFDKQVEQTEWQKISPADKIWIRKDIYVQPIRNNHNPCPQDVYKSLGFKVIQVKSKLKKEYIGQPPQVLRTLPKSEIQEEVETLIFGYSGDTPCENFDHWHEAQLLIHEATFLTRDEAVENRGNKHSHLEDVIAAVAQSRIQQLILGHFSSRYSDAQIDEAIAHYSQKYQLQIPVHRVLPGRASKFSI